MKPLHPATVAASRSAANLWTLKNPAFCLPRRRASTAGRKPLRLFCANNVGRARHSVRAVVSGGARLLTSRLARTLAPPTPGRGLPALPVLPSLFVKGKIPLCGLAIAVVLQLGMLAGSAQTSIYLFSGSETNITLPPGTYIITAYGAPGGASAHGAGGGLGAEISAEFNFSTSTTLTLLVGGGGSLPLNYGVGSPGENQSGAGGGGNGFFINGGGGGGRNFGTGGGTGGGGGRSGVTTGGGGGGGGFLGNGGAGAGAGGFGGGGFGGGGGGSYGGGGGGGYSGGGGYGEPNGSYGAPTGDGGGGGGSIIGSSAITNLAKVFGIPSPDDTVNGEIIITLKTAVEFQPVGFGAG